MPREVTYGGLPLTIRLIGRWGEAGGAEREGTGELSTAYMQSLFGTTFTTGAPPENKDKSLNFAAGATARLDALSTAVDEAKDVTPGVGKTVNGVALTGNQAAHLRDIAKQDRAVQRDRVEQCIDVLVNQGVGGQKLSDGEARMWQTLGRAGLAVVAPVARPAPRGERSPTRC